jgi:hypothetical protein
MTDDDIRTIIDHYEALIDEVPGSRLPTHARDHLAQVRTMIPHMHAMLDEKAAINTDLDGELLRWETIDRRVHCWLGFIQAVLWTSGLYSLDALQRHNARLWALFRDNVAAP